MLFSKSAQFLEYMDLGTRTIGLTNISSVIPTCATATDNITDNPTCVADGRDQCVNPVINWCINPIVLRVEWWFDGKHFSSLNHMKSNCTSYSSCLQRVKRAT